MGRLGCKATTPSEIGARAELAIAVALARAGKNVYLPLFAAHSRMDLVMEGAGGLCRVQVAQVRAVLADLLDIP